MSSEFLCAWRRKPGNIKLWSSAEASGQSAYVSWRRLVFESQYKLIGVEIREEVMVQKPLFMFQVVFPLKRAHCTAIALAGQSRLQSFSGLKFFFYSNKINMLCRSLWEEGIEILVECNILTYVRSSNKFCILQRRESCFKTLLFPVALK